MSKLLSTFLQPFTVGRIFLGDSFKRFYLLLYYALFSLYAYVILSVSPVNGLSDHYISISSIIEQVVRFIGDLTMTTKKNSCTPIGLNGRTTVVKGFSIHQLNFTLFFIHLSFTNLFDIFGTFVNNFLPHSRCKNNMLLIFHPGLWSRKKSTCHAH